MTTFVDRVVLHVAAGDGGHGVASVHREKFKPLGGPDGGNGGNGGSVILVVDPQTTTLLDYHHTPHRKATNGKPGGGDERNGADGADLVLPVPDGTVVKDGTGAVLADLVGDDASFVVARGGRGGLGNKALASPRRKAPGFALLGEPGESIDIVLELKSLADVALIGFPSAGKSSLVSVMSAAPPEDRRLPVHHPGAQPRGRHGRVAALHDGRRARADPGRQRGQGPGAGVPAPRRALHGAGARRRLRDPRAGPRPDDRPRGDRGRAGRLRHRRLAGGPSAVGPHPRRRAQQDRRARRARPGRDGAAAARGARPRGARRLGGRARRPQGAALRAARHVVAARADRARAGAPAGRLRPVAVDDAGFTVLRENTSDGEVFRVRGVKPERWVNQTDFTNDEAVGYLADRLAGSGSRTRCSRPGPCRGRGGHRPRGQRRGLRLGAHHVGGGGLLGGPRGTDLRLEAAGGARPGPSAGAHHDRMDAKTAARAELAEERDAGHWASGTTRTEPDAGHARDCGARCPRAPRRRQGRFVVADRPTGGLDLGALVALVDALAARRAAGHEVVLVSSGAIAAGLRPLNLAGRPRDLATQQAAAASARGCWWPATRRPSRRTS